MYKTTRLCELAKKYGTDKTPLIYHPYTPFYAKLLDNRIVKAVLEIGIDRGASLRMWKEYFPGAAIFGLDINPATLFTEERIETRLCDAGDAAALRRTASDLGGNFDLIVDDASHAVEHQILGVGALLPLLTMTGVYVIEDVASGTQGTISECIRVPHSIHKFYPFDDPYHNQGNNNCLIVVEKSDV